MKISNIDLVADSFKKYVIDKNYLQDSLYYVKRELESITLELKTEKRIANKRDEMSNIFDIFKRNYSNSMKITEENLKLESTKEKWQAHDYLIRTYPYSLFENGYIETNDIESALYFYAINNLNANPEQLENIFPVLRCINMQNIENYDENDYYTNTIFTSYSDIKGTTNPKYQRNTLYETLYSLNDININELIGKIMSLDGLNNARNIASLSSVLLIQNGNCYGVVEGVHRMLLCKILFELSYLIKLNCFDNNNIFYAKALIKK